MSDSPRGAAWRCPHCGPVPAEQVVLYNEHLREAHLPLLPVVPTCRACGAEVALTEDPPSGRGRRIVVLTGTCGSGKSTIAAILMARHGYAAIDGDSVISRVERRQGVDQAGFNGPAILAEIARQIDFLLAAQRDIVLAHVVLAEDMPRYREMFAARELASCFVALRPACATALARTRARTCFSSVTPADVVTGFHEALAVLDRAAADDVIVLDNSTGTAEQAAEWIAAMVGGAAAPG